MASKRKINYQVKLFVPIIGFMLLLLGAFSIIQYNREISYKTQFLRDRLDLLNKRTIDLLDSHESPDHYLNFVNNYFDESILDNLSMTVYDKRNDRELYRIGFEAPLPKGLPKKGTVSGKDIIESANDPGLPISPESEFYYSSDVCKNTPYMVQTLLPYSPELLSNANDEIWWWSFIITVTFVITITTYFTTRHLTKNIRLMRKFAYNAVNDIDFTQNDEFANDDLGEISRQIVAIYNARKAAIASRELEHRVALKATEDRNKLRTQLTNNINHELKTPATIVKGYLDTIADNPDMDDESRNHFLAKSRAQIERLCAILNDISTMTRLEEASKKVLLEEVDFHKLVQDIASDVEESGIAGNMTFIYDVPDDCFVKGNGTMLNGAIMNLLKNSVAYSKGTEMGLKMIAQNQRFYTFIFWDNGQGVGEEHIPMLFERFYRVDKGRSRKAGGTGLGLPIVRSTINTMGGSISVHNRESGGLEFIFTLARWKPKAASPDSPSSEQ